MNKRIAHELNKARTEEAVKAAFVREFKLAFNSEARVDLLVPPVLFEFKLDLNLAKDWPTVLAQALYYVRRIRDESADSVPTWIALIDRNEGVLVATVDWIDLLDHDCEWDRAPSSPCPDLVRMIRERHPTRVLQFGTEIDEFCAQLQSALKSVEVLKRPITADNFEHVFKAWQDALGVDDPKMSSLFVADCCTDVWFDPRTGELASKSDPTNKIQVPARAYELFWSAYERPPTTKAQREIWGRRDRLRAIESRRREGEFYTPPLFCEKARDHITAALGEDWQDEYVVYDPCAGTGNLLWPLRVPGERMFMSTLLPQDVAAIDWYAGATVFQFDFLNDPVEKMPAALREAFKRGRVLVLMNPPYAEATGGLGIEHKDGVKNTLVSKQLAEQKLGKAANELFVQFFWRVHQLCPQATIAMFATLKYISAPAFGAFRAKVLSNYSYGGGFVFPASVFQGTKGSWPVSFAVWQAKKEVK